MRTTTLLITLMSVMVVVFAGVALAKVINGDDNDNTLVGTKRADTIRGKGGDDLLRGLQGDDTLIPGSGADDVRGAAGADVINTVDRSEDLITCGMGGFDRVRANPGDVLRGPQHGCDKVIRDGIRVRGPFERFTP